MEGKITINEVEVKEMVKAWLKVNVFPHQDVNVTIHNITVPGSYQALTIEADFTNEPEEGKGEEDGDQTN